MINKEVKDSVILFNRLRRTLIIVVGFAVFFGVASTVLIESKVVGNVIFFFAVLVVIWFMYFKYRCPKCGELIVNPSGPGIALFPKLCASCGEILKENT